jgi:hypothetical protein
MGRAWRWLPAAVLLFTGVAAAQGGELPLRAYHLGKTLGEALHCNEPAAEQFGALAGHWLRRQAASRQDWWEAVQVFARAAWVLTDTGPPAKTCQEWRPGYEADYRRLRELARR